MKDNYIALTVLLLFATIMLTITGLLNLDRFNTEPLTVIVPLIVALLSFKGMIKILKKLEKI